MPRTVGWVDEGGGGVYMHMYIVHTCTWRKLKYIYEIRRVLSSTKSAQDKYIQDIYHGTVLG